MGASGEEVEVLGVWIEVGVLGGGGQVLGDKLVWG